VLKIVAAVERILAALSDLASKLRQHAEDQGRRMAAKLATDYELDGCRAQRAAAKETLERWEANHRWQVATARAFGGGDGAKPMAWQSLIDTFEACQRRVQSLKAAVRSHQVHLDAFAVDEAALKAGQANATERLRSALETLADVNQAAVEPLMALTEGAESEWIKEALPEAPTATDVVIAQVDHREAVPRRRRAFH